MGRYRIFGTTLKKQILVLRSRPRHFTTNFQNISSTIHAKANPQIFEPLYTKIYIVRKAYTTKWPECEFANNATVRTDICYVSD